MKVHAVAQLFPMLSDAALREMADSIAQEGLINPCVRQGAVLLDGRNRMAACTLAGVEPRFIEYTGDSPIAFILGANLARRHLSQEQKYALYIEVEPLYAQEAKQRYDATVGRPPKSKGHVPEINDESTTDDTPKGKKRRKQKPQARDQAATVVGISGKSGDKLKKLKRDAPDLFQAVIDKTTTLTKAMKTLKARNDKRDLAAAQKTVSVAKRQRIESVCDLRVCSCADLFASGIKPDAVITDPPYPHEFLSVFTELAYGCKAAGVPLVAVMSGQSYLPEVLRRLCEHLTYRWTLAYLTPGGQAVQQWTAKVSTSWKPVLLFGEAAEWFGDVAVSKPNDNDKRFHGWGQSESGMADLVERLTKPGQLVCDPFLGAGTTAVVSLALGRRFVGCDIVTAHVEQTKARVTQ